MHHCPQLEIKGELRWETRRVVEGCHLNSRRAKFDQTLLLESVERTLSVSALGQSSSFSLSEPFLWVIEGSKNRTLQNQTVPREDCVPCEDYVSTVLLKLQQFTALSVYIDVGYLRKMFWLGKGVGRQGL